MTGDLIITRGSSLRRASGQRLDQLLWVEQTGADLAFVLWPVGTSLCGARVGVAVDIESSWLSIRVLMTPALGQRSQRQGRK